MYCKVVKITTDEIIFDNGFSISWDHDQDCCESHYLDFESINLSDFKGLNFNLSNNNKFFEKVEGYGIRLLPVNGHPVSIPGYGKNNGYYSSDLKVVLKMVFDISECQRIIDPDEDEF